MKQGPTRHELGTLVVITNDALQNIVNGNGSIKVHPSDEFVAKAREIHRRRLVGEVTRLWEPCYEVNVTFSDGQILQMKDHWIEPAGPDAKSRELPPAEKVEVPPAAPVRPMPRWSTDQRLRTAREITFEDYRGLGKLVVPKGTRVTATTALGKTDGSYFFVADLRFIPESMTKHDATYYGIRIEAADVEPIVFAVPEASDSPSP